MTNGGSEARVLFGLCGAGGFGREVMPLVRQMPASAGPGDGWECVFVVEGIEESYAVNGYRVISDEEFCNSRRQKRFNVAVADSAARERIAAKMLAAGATPLDIRAGSVTSLDAVDVAEGAILCANVILTSNIRIGRFFHANLNSYVGHDCVVGDFVTFAPSVHCNGHVTIGDHAYVGTGALLRPGIVIGPGAVIGMGAVVTKDVAPGATVVGNPARELKRDVQP